MGCNCGGKRGVQYQFIYTTPEGVQRTYNSEVEAKSAWLRDNKQGAYRKVEKTR